MSKIVISYRRGDTQAIAGRIRDRLAAEYGVDSVFMDIDSIPLGRDFREHIKGALAGSTVLVAIIGPKWLGEKRGKRARIDNPNDPVRVEIETALQLHLDVVPVLVHDAIMPAATELPETIQELSYRNAAIVDDGRDFHPHMDRLIRGIDKIHPRTSEKKPERKKQHRLIFPLSLGVACAIGALGLFAMPTLFSSLKKSGVDLQGDSRTLPKNEGGPLRVPKEDAPSRRKAWPPPSPRSYWELTWDADKALVYLEPTGSSRELYFAELTKNLAAQGIELGDLLFEGRRLDNTYEGKAYLYAGDCGRYPYEVKGIIIQETTVEMSGKAPRVNRTDCKPMRAIDDRFILDEKTIVIKLKHTK